MKYFGNLGTVESPGGGFEVFQEDLLSTTVINYQIKANWYFEFSKVSKITVYLEFLPNEVAIMLGFQ